MAKSKKSQKKTGNNVSTKTKQQNLPGVKALSDAFASGYIKGYSQATSANGKRAGAKRKNVKKTTARQTQKANKRKTYGKNKRRAG
jgi:hypothetical protein